MESRNSAQAKKTLSSLWACLLLALLPAAVRAQIAPVASLKSLGAQADTKMVVVTAKPYNAKGNGTTDDTAAINAAINAAAAGGGVVYLPRGTYKVSGLSINASNLTLRGAGETATVIAMSAATGDTVVAKNGTQAVSNVIIEGIKFAPSVTRTGGAEINIVGGSYHKIRDCSFFRASTAIDIGSNNNGSTFIYVNNIYGQDNSVFLRLTYVIDAWFSGLSNTCPNLATPVAGIILRGGCSSCAFTNVDMVGPAAYTGPVANQGGDAIVTQSLAGGGASVPNVCNFTNCYFDSYMNGLNDGVSQLFSFSNCWFACRPGTSVIAGGNGTTFSNCTVMASGSYGVLIVGQDILWEGGSAICSGGSAGGNVDGIYILTGANHVRINNLRATNSHTNYNSITPSDARQGYGINMQPGIDYISITFCDLTGNLTGNINLTNTPSHFVNVGNF